MQADQILKELKEIKSTVFGMKEEISEIRVHLKDHYLSEDEKKDVREALEFHKKGKLLTKKDVFG